MYGYHEKKQLALHSGEKMRSIAHIEMNICKEKEVT